MCNLHILYYIKYYKCYMLYIQIYINIVPKFPYINTHTYIYICIYTNTYIWGSYVCHGLKCVFQNPYGEIPIPSASECV